MIDAVTDMFTDRKGKYLAENASPLYTAEVFMSSLANSIKDCCEADVHESADDAIKRFKIGCDKVRVLEYMMSMMEQEVYPALKRIHAIEYPDDNGGEQV